MALEIEQVLQLIKQHPQQKQKSKKKADKKRVRFDLDEHTEQKNSASEPLFQILTKTEMERLWWSPNDMLAFKKSTGATVKGLRGNEDANNCLQTAMKASSNRSKFSFWNEKYKQRRTMNNGEDTMNLALNEETGSQAFSGLVDWCRSSDERRGTEKWCSIEVHNARERLFRRALEAVLKEQMHQRILVGNKGDTNEAIERKQLALRNAALPFSVQAGRFAMAMGAADSAAINEEREFSSIKRNTDESTRIDHAKDEYGVDNKVHGIWNMSFLRFNNRRQTCPS